MDGWLQFREINTENCQAELERKMVIFIATED